MFLRMFLFVLLWWVICSLSKVITYQHPTTIFAWVDNLFHFLLSSRPALSWCILMNFCFLPLFSLKYIWYINIWNRNSRNNEKVYKKNQQTKITKWRYTNWPIQIKTRNHTSLIYLTSKHFHLYLLLVLPKFNFIIHLYISNLVQNLGPPPSPNLINTTATNILLLLSKLIPFKISYSSW